MELKVKKIENKTKIVQNQSDWNNILLKNNTKEEMNELKVIVSKRPHELSRVEHIDDHCREIDTVVKLHHSMIADPTSENYILNT